MPAFEFVHGAELDEFTAALTRYGWQEQDFSVAEEEYDPATAEVAAQTGQVILTSAPRIREQNRSATPCR
jgi:hypothetical protein